MVVGADRRHRRQRRGSAIAIYSTCTPGNVARTRRIRASSASALRSPAAPGVVRRAQRAAQRHRPPPLLGIEIRVAAAEREPVGLAHRRHDDDLERPVEIAHHLPDQHRLLHVLPPEARDVGLDQVEQLGDHGEHAGEMARPRGALPPVAVGSRHHADLGPGRIHHRLGWARTARPRRAPRRARGRGRDRADSGRGPRWARTAAG